MTKQPGLHIKNAEIWNGSGFDQRDLYTTDVVVEQRPPNAVTVDLGGYTIFPGLINAHDHLELNHYPRTKFRDCYDNASQWSADVNAHLNESPFRELRAYPLEDRCFIGGLKNLLCGATTVAHHNPPHKCLFRRDFPVRVLKRYGWAHSLYLSSDEEIIASYQRTPTDVPWFIHLAEGTDEAAAGEYRRLKALGCVGKNTIMVHGVALKRADALDATIHAYQAGLGANRAGIKLVWCPSTNYYLLGETIHQIIIAIHARTALGSDSRLTADGDLLDEMCFAHSICQIGSPSTFILASVTTTAAFVCGIINDVILPIGANADFVALKSTIDTATTLCQSHRADLALVVRGGEPQIGDPDMMARFPYIETVRARLDDQEKRLNVKLARQIARCTLSEPGLELLEMPSEFPLTRLWNGVKDRERRNP